MSVHVYEKDGRGWYVRRLELHLALMMGFGLLLVPGEVAGQDQGEDEPAVVNVRPSEARSVEDRSLEASSFEDRSAEARS